MFRLFIVGLLLAAFAAGSSADDCDQGSFGQEEAESFLDKVGSSWLFGQQDSGLSFGLDVLSDASYIATGGLEPQSGAFRTLVDASLTGDLETMFPDRGLRGEVVIGFQSFFGENGNADTGDLITYSNFDNDVPFAQLSALYYQASFLEDDVTLIVGKLDANEIYNASDVSSDFLNSAMGNQPTTFQVLPTYPSPSTSINLQTRLTSRLTGSFGVYDGRLAAGTNTGTSGLQFRDPFWLVAQLDLDLFEDGLSRISIGAWRHTLSNFALLDGTGLQNNQDGLYANLDLKLWSDGEKEALFFFDTVMQTIVSIQSANPSRWGSWATD